MQATIEVGQFLTCERWFLNDARAVAPNAAGNTNGGVFLFDIRFKKFDSRERRKY